jgi:hypothetical protein
VNQVFRVGSSFSTSTGDESEASTFGSLGLVGTAIGTGFMLLDRSTKRASPAFEGNQAITWALNNSGKAVSYDAPNGTVESLPNDRMDVWVGRTRVFDDAAVDNARAAISDLQWSWSAGAGSTMFAHLEARSLDPVAAKATVAEVPSASEVDVHSVELYKPWPNPSSAPIRYAYEIASGLERVDIGVFDIAGRSVRSLVSGTQSRGRYEVVWDGLSNDGVRMRGAVYFLRASVGSSTRVSRVILMK